MTNEWRQISNMSKYTSNTTKGYAKVKYLQRKKYIPVAYGAKGYLQSVIEKNRDFSRYRIIKTTVLIKSTYTSLSEKSEYVIYEYLR